MFRSIPDRLLRRWRARTHTTPNNIQTITVLLSGGGGGADIAFSGSLENFFLFFDGYLQYKSKQFARATPFEVNVHPHMGVDLSGLKETLTYKPIEFLDPAAALPLKWYEAHPVVGNRILCFHFEAEDDNILHLVITGNTWLYRDDLERHLLVVGGGRVVFTV